MPWIAALGLLMLAAVVPAAGAPPATATTAEVQAALAEGARLRQAGDANGALESFHRAAEAAKPESAERARALLLLAGVEVAVGRYAESSRHAADAGRLFAALGDEPGVAASLNRRGVGALYAGDYRAAEQLLTDALAMSTRRGDHEARAEHLTNLGNVQFFVGRYSDAARLYDEALRVTAASGNEAWTLRQRRMVLVNQATLYQRLGRNQEALAAYTALGPAAGGLSPREHGEALINIGVLYRRLGDPIKALAMYDEARTLFSRERALDAELYALNNRGIVLALDLNRLDEAEASFTAALDAATRAGNRRGMLLARLYRGETHLRARHADRAREDFGAGLTLARELHTPDDEWKALYGLGRVETAPERSVEHLEAALRTVESMREAIRIESMRSDFLADKRVVYDALIRARLEVAPADHVFSLLERSHSRVWRDRLGLTGPVALADVQRALPDRMLLLDYWQSAQGSAVVAVSRTRAGVLPIDVDERQVKALIDALAAGVPANWRTLAGDLAARVLPPAEWFADVDRIAVVPDGALAAVPFEALPIGDVLLVQRAAVSYTPTAATLVRPKSDVRRWMAPWDLMLRVFADPIVPAADGADERAPQERLAASALEARYVSSALAGRAAVHLQEDSRKAHLFSTAERAPILHVATHAVADASAMEQSRIMFSPAAGSTRADYLYLKEAYRLPLSGVELAVLSACDTERGRFVGGEGVQSFSRAFLASGVRTTVTTMWRVADGPTANFMQLFYHHLQRGEPRDEALRRAKLRFLEPGSGLAHPHFWAAFVLTGDAVAPIPRAISWTAVAASALGLFLAASLVLSMRRRTSASPAAAAV